MASTEPAARRVWTDDEKRTILAEVAGGKPITEVSRHWQVNTSTIYYWRSASEKNKRPAPGRLAAAASTRPKQSRVELASRPTYVEVADTRPVPVERTHPRGLSYEQLLDENERLWTALQALISSRPR